MKYYLAAAMLVIAAPAVAQTAPAPAAQHQGHDQHRQHAPAQHGQHAPAHHGQHQGGQQGQHRDGCCADRDGNGRMDCCEGMGQQAPAAPARPQGS